MAVNKVSFTTAAGEQTLIDLTDDTAAVDTVFEGETFHGADGEQKTGAFTIQEELTEQDALLTQLASVLSEKAEAGNQPPVLQEKSVTPTESEQVVQPDEGYDGLSQVTVGAIPEEYVVPSGTLSITENGTYSVADKDFVDVLVESGGSMETVSVTVNSSDKTTVYYTGENGLLKSDSAYAHSIQCIKKSLFVVIASGYPNVQASGVTALASYTQCYLMEATTSGSVSLFAGSGGT